MNKHRTTMPSHSPTNEIDDVFDDDELIIESMLRRGATPEEAAAAVNNMHCYGSPYSPDEAQIINEAFDDLFAQMSGEESAAHSSID